jgi:hypothetical protein
MLMALIKSSAPAEIVFATLAEIMLAIVLAPSRSNSIAIHSLYCGD